MSSADHAAARRAANAALTLPVLALGKGRSCDEHTEIPGLRAGRGDRADSRTRGRLRAGGATATLSVDYRFVAQGRKEDKYDLHEWLVRRGADVVAELVAAKPQPLPGLHPPEAQQMARLQQQQVQAQKTATQMAPMMADVQAIVARCGDDEKCIERETMKLGAGLSGTQRLDDTLKAGQQTAAAMQPGADRYQRWQAKTQKGSYTLDESWHVVHADPICMSLPKARCTHDMTRKGSGEFAPSGSPAQVEFDLQAGTMIVQLPVPMAALAYVETHSTDEPAGTHSTPTPKGPLNGQLPLRVTADGKSVAAPLKIALKGGWRSQSGEQVVPMGAGGWHNAAGDGGKLVVRWRFTAL